MKILKQKIKKEDGTVLNEITHIYAEDGYFTENGKITGVHIEFSDASLIDRYTEVKDDKAATCVIPDSLPDIIVLDSELDEELPAEEALKELQEVIENEEI
jgi:hypothetical protein